MPQLVSICCRLQGKRHRLTINRRRFTAIPESQSTMQRTTDRKTHVEGQRHAKRERKRDREAKKCGTRPKRNPETGRKMEKGELGGGGVGSPLWKQNKKNFLGGGALP